jgi:hypothetical protein
MSRTIFKVKQIEQFVTLDKVMGGDFVCAPCQRHAPTSSWTTEYPCLPAVERR